MQNIHFFSLALLIQIVTKPHTNQKFSPLILAFKFAPIACSISFSLSLSLSLSLSFVQFFMNSFSYKKMFFFLWVMCVCVCIICVYIYIIKTYSIINMWHCTMCAIIFSFFIFIPCNIIMILRWTIMVIVRFRDFQWHWCAHKMFHCFFFLPSSN